MLNFYYCDVCGNLIEVVEASGVTPSCCGQDMIKLLPAKEDVGYEKHVPVIAYKQCITAILPDGSCKDVCLVRIRVGENEHPMMENHRIEWIFLETDRGVYRRCMKGCENPKTSFFIDKKEQVRAIYSFCNLHGLWVNTVE